MKKTLVLLISLISFCCVSAVQAATVEPLNRIVAVVNNDIITQSSLDQKTAMMRKQLQLANQPVPPDSVLRKQTLKQMIDQQLVLQAATKAKVIVTDSQVNTAVAAVAQQNHLSVTQLKQQITKQGVNYNDYQQQVRQQLIMNIIERQAVGNTIHVSDAEVRAAMKKIQQPAGQPITQYHLQALLVPLPQNANPAQVQTAQNTANNIITQLQKGADFDSVATSQAAAIQGGDMGWKQLNQLPPAISGQIAATVAGSIVGPLQTPTGFYILKVVATRTVNPPQPSAAQTAAQVRQMLFFEKFQKAAQKWADQLRATAYVKIMND